MLRLPCRGFQADHSQRNEVKLGRVLRWLECLSMTFNGPFQPDPFYDKLHFCLYIIYEGKGFHNKAAED